MPGAAANSPDEVVAVLDSTPEYGLSEQTSSISSCTSWHTVIALVVTRVDDLLPFSVHYDLGVNEAPSALHLVVTSGSCSGSRIANLAIRSCAIVLSLALQWLLVSLVDLCG